MLLLSRAGRALPSHLDLERSGASRAGSRAGSHAGRSMPLGTYLSDGGISRPPSAPAPPSSLLPMREGTLSFPREDIRLTNPSPHSLLLSPLSAPLLYLPSDAPPPASCPPRCLSFPVAAFVSFSTLVSPFVACTHSPSISLSMPARPPCPCPYCCVRVRAHASTHARTHIHMQLHTRTRARAHTHTYKP